MNLCGCYECYMGAQEDAAQRERLPGPAKKTEKVWVWNCDTQKDCWRKSSNRPVTVPAGTTPKPCRSCGDESFRKVGEKVRMK